MEGFFTADCHLSLSVITKKNYFTVKLNEYPLIDNKWVSLVFFFMLLVLSYHQSRRFNCYLTKFYFFEYLLKKIVYVILFSEVSIFSLCRKLSVFALISFLECIFFSLLLTIFCCSTAFKLFTLRNESCLETMESYKSILTMFFN